MSVKQFSQFCSFVLQTGEGEEHKYLKLGRCKMANFAFGYKHDFKLCIFSFNFLQRKLEDRRFWTEFSSCVWWAQSTILIAKPPKTPLLELCMNSVPLLVMC